VVVCASQLVWAATKRIRASAETTSGPAYCDGLYMARIGNTLFSLPLKLNTVGCYASATFSP
jgi:hypothetical protein